jgi:molybdenum cofactor guanylyltransferase
MSKIEKNQLTAVILAGGMGRRMGGRDKGQVELQGHPLIEYVINAIRPQVNSILINANRHQDDYARYGCPVISDMLEGYQGPLAGFAAGMQAAVTPYIVTVPCDGPLLADDLVQRLCAALCRENADIAVAHDGRRMQPVYALISTALLPSLQVFLAAGNRKIDQWYACHTVALADFSDSPDTFRNINTPEDHNNIQNERLGT